MRLNEQHLNDSRKRDYLRDTLDIINGEERVTDFSDLLFYFRTLKEKERRYPHPELKSLFNPMNIYPFYYFMPFLFVNNIPERNQCKEKIRLIGIVSTLIARRTILTDLFADEQYEQLISRDMGDLKKENLGYYIQILDFEIDKIISDIFSDDVFFRDSYNLRFNEYINTMLTERELSPLISMDDFLFKKYATGKSVLHLLVSDMVLGILKRPDLRDNFDQMLRSFIMYLTIQDDVLDIVEDMKKQQPSHFYPWISGGKIIHEVDENTEKAIILKFYLGGGVERCEAFFYKYVNDIKKQSMNTGIPLDSWLKVIDKMSKKTSLRIKNFKVASEELKSSINRKETNG
ncbi:class 1 isoprenoid biosynthesis enzyme [Salmonella enterica subsp. enterica serovar Newport]|nr:class 1 isoprenoid biosynthesis enzyme [Salmonella enterica subsp. enterica serovar Infantis]EDT3088347.1 class 1 isoprenoid biosynthesis enzyme [Salmonella enterica subsp. enterica serovar Newport]EGI5078403.1 hypothetical protein [Salmonella enterica subsp. enterica serovar Infantis]